MKKSQPTFFLDQDNTLLLLSGIMEIIQMGNWANNNSIFADIMGNEVGIIPRPYLTQFLKECRRMGKVYVLTAGISSFQEEVLKAIGVLNMVDGVYGRDSYGEVPKHKNSILIDNLPHDHPNSVAKLNAMGGGFFLKVSDWEGINPRDNALLKIIPKLQKWRDSLVDS